MSRDYLRDEATEQRVTNNYSSTSLSAVTLTVFASINEAAFAFVGMLTLLQGSGIPQSTQYGLGIGSGLSALSIECEIFYENITEGLKYAYTHEGLKLKIVSDIILKEYNKNPHTDNEFLRQYANHFIALNSKSQCKHHGPSDPEKARQASIVTFELMQMDRTLLNYFENKGAILDSKIKNTFDELFKKDEETYRNTYWRKNFLRQTATFFNVMSLPGCFFASAFMAKELLIFATGATGALLTGGTLIIATIACASFFVMMYSTFCDLIYNNLLQKHYNQLKNIWLNQDKNGNAITWGLAEKLFTRSKIILTTALFAGLIVLLTLATAGTWVQSGLSGQIFLLNLSQATLNTLIIASTSLYTAIVVIFNIKNIMATISFLFTADFRAAATRGLEKLNTKLTTLWNELFADNSLIQRNQTMAPFLIPLAVIAYGLRLFTMAISAIWKIVSLIIHCGSEGVTTDKGFFISVWLSALSNGIAEFFTDAPYIFDCQAKRDLELGKKLDPNHEGVHQHTGLLGFVFFLAMSPILFTNYFLCRLLTEKTAKTAWNEHVSSFWYGHEHSDKAEHTHSHAEKHSHKEHGHGHGDHHKGDCQHSHKESELPMLSQFWETQIKENMKAEETAFTSLSPVAA